MAVGCLIKTQDTTNRVQIHGSRDSEKNPQKTTTHMPRRLGLGTKESGWKQGNHANMMVSENRKD